MKGCTSGIYMLNFTWYTFKVVHVCVVCARVCVSERVFVCLHNLTRDYMSPAELMSKSTGSALGLTGGRAERERETCWEPERESWRDGGRRDDFRGWRERKRDREGIQILSGPRVPIWRWLIDIISYLYVWMWARLCGWSAASVYRVENVVIFGQFTC